MMILVHVKPESQLVGREKTSERDYRVIAKKLKADRFKTAATGSREFNAIMKKKGTWARGRKLPNKA